MTASPEDRTAARTGLERVVREEREALIRAAKTFVRSREEAEDVVHDTLALVWRRRRALVVRDWRAYCFQAVRFNALKRLQRRRDLPSLDEHPHLELAAVLPDPGDGPDVPVVELERALGALPPAQQTAIRLRFYLGRSFREIGEALSISTFTAASRVRYGLAGLRRGLKVSSRLKQQGGSR